MPHAAARIAAIHIRSVLDLLLRSFETSKHGIYEVRSSRQHTDTGALCFQAFPGSNMGRDLTSIRCTVNGESVLIMTSHMESEKQGSSERKAQFQQVGINRA